MSGQPLVSIIAVNYNCERFLLETLDSIAKQTYENIDLIIIDDCSLDNSRHLIRKWIKDYQKSVIFIENEKNIGLCATLNKALTHARGEYLSLTATDDILLPEKTERQVAIMENSGSDVAVVYSDAYLLQENGEARYGWFIQELKKGLAKVPSGNIYQELLDGNFIPAMTAMYKRKILEELGGWDETLSYEDYDMWLRIARKYKFIYSDYISAKYRMRNDSLVNSIKNWSPDGVKIFSKHLDQPKAVLALEQIAVLAYQTKDYLSLNLLKNIKCSNKIKAALNFARLRVPASIGIRIIRRVK